VIALSEESNQLPLRVITRHVTDYMNNINILAKTFGEQKRWVNYKLIEKDGKLIKPPFKTDGSLASSTDSGTWSNYEDAIKSSPNVGIIFTPDKLLLGIDIDHCLEDGVISHVEKEKIEKLVIKANTYTEISPSNTGLHLFLSLTEPLEILKNKSAPFEVYISGRYFTVTNNPYIEARPVRTVTPDEAFKLLSIIGYPWNKKEDFQQNIVTLNTLSLSDEEIITKIFSSKNGAKIKSLYNGDISTYGDDDSSADLALCSYLAFWTQKDHSQIERVWLNSPLGKREKTQSRKDYRDRTIETAINGCSEVYSKSRQQKEDKSDVNNIQTEVAKDNTLLNEICNRSDVTLFCDEQKDTYIALDILGHQEIWPCDGSSIKNLLAYMSWNKNKKPLGSESTKSIIAVMEGKARFEGKEIKLHNRVAWHDGSLWYDLTNKQWQAIKICESGWEIIGKPPIIFNRYSHQQSQITPNQNGNIDLFLRYINITNPEHRLLFLVFLVSCFIPDFPHVMLVIFGAQGSSKSTFSKLTRMTIDPSMIDVVALPEK